jgi:AraC-like DNA-binding protein
MPSAESVQASFYKHLAPQAQIGRLFDDTPAVLYFVKDREGRFISGNKANLEWLGMREESQLVGTCDRDHFPPEIAEIFIEGDRQIISSRLPMINEPELIRGADSSQKWFVTTKRPLFDKTGNAIGIAGVTQSRETLPAHAAASIELRQVVAHIRAHQDRAITLAELAAISSMSERQLYRKFDDAFHTSPLRFALLTRLRSARQALVDTSSTIGEIAYAYGFCDQSALTRHFRKEMGITPSAFRNKMLASSKN